MAASHRVVFTPSGLDRQRRRRHHRARRGAPARRRPRLGVRRPRHLRALPGRARRSGRSPSGASTSTPTRSSAPAALELDYHGQPAARSPGNGSAARRGSAATSSIDVPADEPGAPPGRPQGPRPRRRSSSTRRSRCSTSRSPPAELGDAVSGRAMLIGDARRRAARRRRRRRRRAAVLRDAAPALAADGAATVTVAVRRRPTSIVAVWPGFVDAAYGVAVDVGSTTIAGHLCDLSTGEVLASAGRMNPQIRFGEDLMSRVSYVMMNPGGDARADRGGPRRARRADRRARRDGRRRRAIASLDVVLVGNPIMHHLVLGIDPTPLGHGAVHAGHRPRRSSASAADLELDLPDARVLRRAVHRRPRRRRHRRGDARRGPAPRRRDAAARRRRHQRRDRARRPRRGSSPRRARPGRRSRAPRSAAASAPRRAPIERVRIDPRHARAAVQGDRRRRRGRDDPGFADAVAVDGRHRRVRVGHHRRHRRDVPRRRDRRRRHDRTASWPTRIAARRRRRPHVRVRAVRATATRELSITQNDVRAIQLAKAALRAGIDLLIEHAGIPTVDRHPPGRRVRRPHRPAPRAGARARARLPGRRRAIGRQRRRRRRRAGAAVAPAAGRDGDRRAPRSSRSRPRPSRGSRSCSSRRWRFPHATAPTAPSSTSSVAAARATADVDRADAGRARPPTGRRQETHGA